MTDQDLQPLRRLRQGGADVQERMNAEFPVEFRLQWDMLNAYLRGLQTDPATTMMLGAADGTIRLLSSRIFDSLDAAHMLLYCGYSIRVAALIRAAKEDLLTWAYVKKFPADADLWSDVEFGDPRPQPKKPAGSPKGPAKRQVPKFETMRDRLGDDNPTAGRYGYSLLSMLTHPRSLGLALQIAHHGDSVSIRRGPQFNFVRAGMAYGQLMATTGFCLLYLVEESAGKNDEWVSEATPVVNAVAKWTTSTGPDTRESLTKRIRLALDAELAVFAGDGAGLIPQDDDAGEPA